MADCYYCQSPQRRKLVAATAGLNGIDYLEVLDSDLAVIGESLRQRVLLVRSLKPLDSPASWSADRVVIEGGVRVRGVKVVFACVLSKLPVTALVAAKTLPASSKAFFLALKATAEADRTLFVLTDVRGDFSAYTLRLRESLASEQPPPKFDSELFAVEFRFKVECPSPFDCRAETLCVTARQEPELDYLAKDYLSFRRLMLDRLSALLPDWTERNPADLQVALVELLAYTGDHLSYFQDFAATEAYLATARSRVSVRRHARLLDYRMHDGANARAWICFEVGEPVVLEQGATICSRTASSSSSPLLSEAEFAALRDSVTVFETLERAALTPARNRIEFHTWGDENCCLVRGATRATVRVKDGLTLKKGDVLVFEEVRDPETGAEGAVDRRKRHPVRLVEDPVADVDKAQPQPLAVLRIRWHDGDALPFTLCLTRTIDKPDGTSAVVDAISVARGNVALADHGARAAPPLTKDPASSGDLSLPGIEPGVASGGRFRPLVLLGPLTQACPLPAAGEAAAAASRSDPLTALPEIELAEYTPGAAPGSFRRMGDWRPEQGLLGLDALARAFVVEVELDGSARLRFGDDIHGRQPESGRRFFASYRVGNGAAGNVGAEVLTRVVLSGKKITRVWNPLAAVGGIDPEPAERVKLVAPAAFRTQQRAVTEADYAAVARRFPGVEDAIARFRWTGSWYTVYVSVDRAGGRPIDTVFRQALLEHFDRFRMAGHDLDFRDPLYIPLEIALRVCVKPGYFTANVHRELLDVFSGTLRASGEPGFFHPDRFRFGQPLYLSQLFDAALSVSGVQSVSVLNFQRLGRLPAKEIANGFIGAAPEEILRLDNDPNFPENGSLAFDLRGGL